MLIRALVILLLVLNFGVALWWAMESAPAPTVPADVPPGVERLHLLAETVPPTSVSPKDVAPAQEAPVPLKIVQCASFGPFDSASAASGAGTHLQAEGLAKGLAEGEVAKLVKTAVRLDPGRPPRSWRVLLPPLSSAAESDVVAKRIAATGFKDYYVIRTGDDANAIALGLFGNESAARDRAATMAKAGFDAMVDPVGAGAVEHWLDMAADGPFQTEPLRRQLGATRTEPVDCDRFAADTSKATLDVQDNSAPR